MKTYELENCYNTENYSAALDDLSIDEINTIVIALSNPDAINETVNLNEFWTAELQHFRRILILDDSEKSNALIDCLTNYLYDSETDQEVPLKLIFNTIEHLYSKNIREIDKLILKSDSAYWNLRLASEIYGVDAKLHIDRAIEIIETSKTVSPM